MEFILEKWQTQYLDDFIKATDDPHLSDNLCENLPYPMDKAFALEYIKERMLNNESRQMCRAIVIDGHAVGGTDIILGSGVFSRSAELSLWIAQPYRRQGLGAAVIAQMCKDTFEQYDVIRIESHPYAEHTEAAAALRSAGFTHEGTVHSAIFKNDTAYDYDIYALLRN